MSIGRAKAHENLRKGLTTAILACNIAGDYRCDPDDRELYRILEITLREAGELLDALELSTEKARLRSVTA